MLVTDGEQRAALASVRALGRAGYEVHVCSARTSSISGASRFCSRSYKVADPLRDPGSFVADVKRLAASTKADVLLPVTEAALLAVLPHRESFDCAIPFADASAFRDICDKRKVLAAAKAHGIAVPSQNEIATADDVSGLNGSLQFPLVLKPNRSVAERGGERIHAGVSYATSSADLKRALDRIPGAAYPLLLQQHIDGAGFGISVLVWDGELVAAFSHRRVREKPPSGGVSVFSESIPLDNDLLLRSLSLLKDFSWQGVAMVEYKLDAVSGIPFLMEINGRLWGSLQLAIDAGVDFPRLLVEAALGALPAPVTTFKAGVRLRWEWGEVDHLLASLFHSAPAVAVSRNKLSGGRFAAVTDFFRGFAAANRGEVFRADDPRPFLRETLDWLRRR
ncbi:MAG: ATP-grasp domain-containing protein [Gemmatimonadota bacterium]|nr:ATP-grasp domain-containing protein [Gemmatimonadota bacterium]